MKLDAWIKLAIEKHQIKACPLLLTAKEKKTLTFHSIFLQPDILVAFEMKVMKNTL